MVYRVQYTALASGERSNARGRGTNNAQKDQFRGGSNVKRKKHFRMHQRANKENRRRFYNQPSGLFNNIAIILGRRVESEYIGGGKMMALKFVNLRGLPNHGLNNS